MIIVEGPDGAGKTSLITRLRDDLGVETRPRHCTSEDGPLDGLLQWVEDDLKTHVHEGIYDRHPLISELVYGPIIRGEALLGDDVDRLVNVLLKFKHYDPLIIMCLPPRAQVRVNVAQNHQADTAHQQGVLKYTDGLWSMYYYRYIELLSNGFRVLRWDYTDETRPYENVRHLVEVNRAG